MSDSYKVKVNDSFQFDFDKEQISRLDAVNMDTNTLSYTKTNPTKRRFSRLISIIKHTRSK
jgi:hypothetical protein